MWKYLLIAAAISSVFVILGQHDQPRGLPQITICDLGIHDNNQGVCYDVTNSSVQSRRPTMHEAFSQHN